MFENAIKLTTTKLASTSFVSLLPGTLILISGIVVWRLWNKQTRLHVKTNELNNEVKEMKKQIAELEAIDRSYSEPVPSELATSVSSYIKKMDRYNPWSKDKQ